jgi:hypothetical protein
MPRSHRRSQLATKQVNGKLEEVTLVRPGVGTETVALAEGSTLGDLCRQAGINASDSSILIDGRELVDQLLLKAGMVVTVMPQPERALGARSWRDLMGDFHEDPAFEEVMSIVEAERKAEKEQE